MKVWHVENQALLTVILRLGLLAYLIYRQAAKSAWVMFALAAIHDSDLLVLNAFPQ